MCNTAIANMHHSEPDENCRCLSASCLQLKIMPKFGTLQSHTWQNTVADCDLRKAAKRNSSIGNISAAL